MQIVNLGTAANAGDGDPLRTAFGKANANDAELLSGVLGAIWGLTLSTAGASTSFGVAAGAATDKTGVAVLPFAAAVTKTTSAWAVGSGNGSLDTGSIANSTWYHVHLIQRTDIDPAVTDVLISTSATAPTLPASYTLSRRIGAIKTNGSGQWTKFVQDGDLFMWDVPVTDVNAAANPGTAAVLRALSVPPGINVTAIFHARCSTATASSAVATIFTDPAIADTAPDFFNSQQIGNTTLSPFANLRVRTNTSRQIRARSNFSDANVALTVVTEGWVDTRGRMN
ncbi:hypothetical protein [Mesorhizobium sp.]|uniref:hypothetical protein n=1 Tax=Mesorhizobium sp. TaxID=1871066 RepID=UPI0025EAB187|nr:hypothetical protein [Mesorhizobium sp.]